MEVVPITLQRTKTMIITSVILSIALTSVFAFDTNTTENNTLDTELPYVVEALSGDTHDITMEAVAMPDGLFVYRMVSYTITN